jgi:hypothetical protein
MPTDEINKFISTKKIPFKKDKFNKVWKKNPTQEIMLEDEITKKA